MCPRIDSQYVNTRIQTLNAELCVLASDKDCLWIDNDKSFYRLEDEVKRLMFKDDSKYLSTLGTQQLTANLFYQDQNKEWKTATGRKQKLGTGYKDKTSELPRNKWEQPRCHYCSETGHMKESCHHKKPVVCYTCGYTGHKSKLCKSSWW